MKTSILLSLVCALLFVGNGNSEDEVAPLYKEGFVATFGQFRTMPQTREDAEAKGWKFDGNDCNNNGEFYGFRYYEPDNIAIALLYGENGDIVGFQSIFPNDVFDGSSYRFEELPMIQPTEIEGNPWKQITIYIVHPSQICDPGTPTRDLDEVIDVNVFYQNGPSPDEENLIELPRNRPNAEVKDWDSFGCFPQMGYHSLHHSRDFGDSHCTKFDPTLALYDTEKGTLIGCGVWIYARSPNTSDRFEKPPPEVVKKIVGEDFDECIFKDVTTSLHMYFVDNPASITCAGS